MRLRCFISRKLIPALFLCATAGVYGQTTAFTYQGRLTQSGASANASYDMQFRLFDVPASGSGTQQGPTLTFDGAGGNPLPVVVTGGIFTVQLDFGSVVFATGSDLYLEVSLRPAGSGGYTSLGPRQRVVSTPYAIRSSVTGSASIAGNADLLDGLDSTNFALAIHGHTVSQVTNAASTAAANTFTGTQTVQTGGAANKGIVVRAAAGQTSNLQDWQNNSGTTMASMSASGDLTLPLTTRLYSIAGLTFVSAESAKGYTFIGTDRVGTVSGQTVTFLAPIHLPAGANITQLQAVVLDNATENITVSLQEVDSGSSGNNASIASSGASTSYQTLLTSVNFGNPLNGAKAYFIEARWTVPAVPGSIALRLVTVTYTVTSPLP